jgi:hypothetical protein
MRSAVWLVGAWLASAWAGAAAGGEPVPARGGDLARMTNAEAGIYRLRRQYGFAVNLYAWNPLGADLGAYKPISVNGIWESQWVGTYDGTGWYVLDVTIPETGSKRVWLLFGAVDDSWKAWLDGEPIGHSVGDPGDIWDKPAAVEITGRYKPGRPVHLVVRVNDIAGGGGIWRGASIMGTE